MRINIGAMLTIGTSGADKAAKKTKDIAENMRNAQERAKKVDEVLGKTGTSAARRSGAFNDRDGVSTRENRGAKGVSGQRGAAGRDFAGLRDASDSTSGIVAAYATAAANMFAITAAFKALSDAAKVEQLKKGLELVGSQSGISLGLVSKNIEKVTGYAISSAEAMKSVASATAAGFSSKEIERLAIVAKGASTALGRDMADAMDRLTRGSIKLEPELLDELGIMTRIDDATRAYADAHDKAKSSLTQTERRQAFLNAVLQEGEDKFGSIADAVDVSPFDKLTASMKNMATGGIGFLVKQLEPLVSLLAAMPLLIMIPISGIVQSIVTKLVPTAEMQIKKLGNMSKQAAEREANSRKNQLFRNQDIVDYTSLARVKSGKGLGMDVNEEDLTLPTLKKESAALDRRLAQDRETLRIVKLTNDARSNAVLIAEKEVSIGEAAQRYYKKSITAITKDVGYAYQGGKRAMQFDSREGSKSAYEETQRKLAEKDGNIGAQANVLRKGMAAQWAVGSLAVAGYKQAIIAANAEAGKGPGIITRISAMWAMLGVRVFALGNIMKLAMQGLVYAIPVIGWIIAGITTVMALFDMMKSDKDRAIEEARNQLKTMLEDSKKVATEVAKFRETGKYGRAFEAELTNLGEVYSKLKEIIVLKGKAFEGPKATVDKGITNAAYRSMRLAGGDEEISKGLNVAFKGIASIKGSDYVDNLSSKLEQLKKDNKDWLAILDREIEQTQAISKSWSDIGEAVKTGGTAIRKFWGDDFFKTDYTDIAATFRTITTEIKAQEQYIIDPAARMQANSDIISKFVAGGKDMFLELDRVMGSNTNTFADIYNELNTKQVQINNLLKAGDQASIDRAKELNAQLMIRQNEVKNTIVASGALEKIALEEFKIKLATIQLESAKSKVTLQELNNAARITNNTIKASKQAMDRMKTAQGFDILVGYDKVDAIQQAAVELKNAQDISSLKNDVLDREFKLAELQRALMASKAELELDDAKKEFNKKYPSGSPSMGGFGGVAYAAYSADKASLDIRQKIVDLLKEVDKTTGAINDASKTANENDVKAKQQALAFAKESFRTSIDNLKKTQDIASAILDVELKIAAAKRESFVNTAELQRTKEINDAARTSFGSLDQLGELRQTKDKAILDQWKTIFEELDRRKKEQENINNLKSSMQAAQDQVATAYMGANVDVLIAATDNFATHTRAYDLAIQAQTTSGLAAASATAAHAEALRNATNLINDIKDMPGWLSKKKDATVQNRLTANTAVGMNMAGAGPEFTALLGERWSQVGKTVYGGDYKKFLEKEDINLIKQYAFEMKELTVLTEGITNISSAFHSELTAAFSAIIDGSKDAGEAFGDMALSMLKLIADLIAQLIAMQIVKAAGSMFGIPMPAAAGGTMPKGLADGGIMSRAAGGVQGIVNKPTYLVGEGRYNEAVVPLPNGRAIPVQMHGGNSSSNNVQVNVHLNGSGEATKTESQGPDMNNLGAMISQAVLKELQAQKMPGGVLSRYGAA